MKWLVLISFAFSMISTGCIGGLVATTGYQAVTDERSVGTQVGDTQIWSQIKRDLLQSDVAGTGHITVFCTNGVVVLVGIVEDGSAAGGEAVRIARKVDGVKKVFTYFLPHRESVISDFEIKEKIHYKMVADPELKADQVDMAVIDGHVVLVGVVTSSGKARKVIAIAHDTSGVKAVKSYIQVVP